MEDTVSPKRSPIGPIVLFLLAAVLLLVPFFAAAARGTELWADFRLRLPAGTGASVRNEVGRISAAGVSGTLTAKTGSGEVRLAGVKGGLDIGTGSGGIEGNDLAVAGTKVSSSRKLEVGVGGGGVPVKVRTSSGNIRLQGK